MEQSRRGFIRATAGGIAGIAVVGKARAEDVTFTGRLVSYDGQPIERAEVYHDSKYHSLDNNGRFSIAVESYSDVKPALYKGEGDLFDPIQNGVPHLYNLGEYGSGDGRDIGTISIPRGYLVQMRALNANGDPVEDAQPHLRHGGYGASEYILTTNSEGYMIISDTTFTGFELHGSVETAMTIPSAESGTTRLEKTIDVTSSMEVVFQVDKGVTVHNTSRDTEPQQTESTDTATQSITDTPVPSTTESHTQTKVSTTLPDATPTSATAPVGSPTAVQSPTPTQTAGAVGTSSSPSEASRPQRGFLSNGSPGELSFLSNPFFLTVGGFVLSVGGIVYQLLRGN